MAFDSGVIQTVKARIDIADVVRRYVDLRNVGGRLVGVCPFHQETKGSFNVHPDKGFFHCFGCQASGDVIDFYCRINGLEFRDALEQLADEAGVQLDSFRPDPRADEKRRRKQACLEMHSLAEAFYRRNLAAPMGEKARAYLDRRRMSPEIVEAFGLGCGPEAWQGLQDFLRTKGYDASAGVEAGLLSRNDKGRTWDRFRDRLIFPIRDVAGKVIAFGGRILGDGDPKYLNSADSPIYKKGLHLYGLDRARTSISRTRRAFMTEGYMDVAALHQFGYTEACGVLGTALTDDQTRRLLGFCRHVDLVFDGDAPGRKAAMRAAEMILAHGASCRAVLMPEGEDVDSLLHAGGRDAFEACLQGAPDGLDFCLAMVGETCSPKETLAWAREFLDSLRDGGLRALYIPKLVRGLGVSEREMRDALLSGRGGTSGAGARRGGPEPMDAAARRREEVPRVDAQLLEFAVLNRGRRPALAEAGLADALRSDPAKAFWSKLATLDENALLTALDQREKAFFTRVHMKQPLPEEDMVRQWEDISSYLHKFRLKSRKRELQQALRRARAKGNTEDEFRLLTEFNSLLVED